MSWDKDKPAATTSLKQSNPQILANNAAIEAALDQDHDFTTGGTQTGKHNKVTLIETANLGTGAEGVPILGAQTVSGKAELVFTDEDDNDIQITSGGKILSASLDSKDEDDMASDSASHTATQQSIKAYVDSGIVTMTNKTLTSPVLNGNLTGDAVLDEDDMASDSAVKVPTQQSTKAYVDTKVSESLGSWASKTFETAYQASTDGFVCGWCKGNNSNFDGYMQAFTDSSNPPTTERMSNQARDTGQPFGIMIPVKKGDYWKVTITVADQAIGTSGLFWIPLGG